MPNARGSRAAFKNSRQQAGLILAVLLIHLLFMASPLHDAMLGHDAMLEAESPVLTVAHVDSAQMEAVTLDAATHHEYHVHCGIEWATTYRGIAPVTPSPVAVAATTSVLDLQRAVTPTARAIGPPANGDAQAVLQVFRL